MVLTAQPDTPNHACSGSTRSRWTAFTLGLLMALNVPSGYALAQETSALVTSRPVNIAPSASTNLVLPSPDWQDLTPEQQQNLRPLVGQWNQLKDTQKRKWMALGANYAHLAPADQVKLHSRMTEWVKLSQQQRAQARLAYANTQKLSSHEKQANWQAYQALSSDDKKKLLKAGSAKSSGAATASKPVTEPKLVPIPAARDLSRPVPDMAKALQGVQPKTLLPVKPQP